MLFANFCAAPKYVLILQATEEDLIILRNTRYCHVPQYVINYGRSDTRVTRFTVFTF
jgi:hypothetical protein